MAINKKGVDNRPLLCYTIIKIKEGRHYLFEDEATGEEFIVGEYCVEKAYLEAKLYFDEPHYICEFSDVEAEMSGLDEY